ncbi:MAG: hypothetical protein IJ800_01750 [Clostridia bacterium]|nr:hypothetical protein [Clostridia bacterium]
MPFPIIPPIIPITPPFIPASANVINDKILIGTIFIPAAWRVLSVIHTAANINAGISLTGDLKIDTTEYNSDLKDPDKSSGNESVSLRSAFISSVVKELSPACYPPKKNTFALFLRY